MDERIRSSMEAASSWLREHPDEASYTDSVATARIASGLHVTVSGPGGESLDTDMPAAVGGDASTFSPGWAYRAALAACVLSLATMRAAARGVAEFHCEVDVDSQSDDRGILGVEPGIPAGPLRIRIGFRMSAAAGDQNQLEEIAAWAVEHCPVSEAVTRHVPLHIEIERLEGGAS